MAVPTHLHPTPRMRRIYQELAQRWGEPEHLITYDGREAKRPSQLPFITVGVWPADDDCDVTTVMTLGMSEKAMVGADYRVELHFGYRGSPDPAEISQSTYFMANLSEYPFMHGLKLDWWERISNPGMVPRFPGATSLLLRPALVEGGLNTLDDPEFPIKVLTIVPLTSHETHLLAEHGRSVYLKYVEEQAIDVLENH